MTNFKKHIILSLGILLVGNAVLYAESENKAIDFQSNWPAVLRCVLSWPKGDIVNISKVDNINANLVHTFPAAQGVMGFRPPQMVDKCIKEKWRSQVEQLRKMGIIVLASQSSVMFSKDAFSKYGLDCDNYYGVNEHNEPQIAFGGEWGNIFTSCINNPAWMELHLKTTMLYAAAGFDGIWYDVNINADENAFYCQCDYCRRSWKKYLADNHLCETISLPTKDTGKDVTKSINFHHLLWRLQCWQNAFKPLMNAVKKKFPRFAFSHNLGVLNADRIEGIYFHAMTNMYDFVHYEECGHSCSPYTNIPSYLIGLACGENKPVILVQNSKPVPNNIQHEIFLAEGYATGGFPQIGFARYTKDTKTFFDFVSRNQKYYTDTESMANVAIMLSWKSRVLYESSNGLDPARRFAEILLFMHVPFDFIIAERDFNIDVLGRYKTLILPDLACISDQQISVLQQFVGRGGGIVATHNFGKYTEFFKERPRSAISLIAGKEIKVTSRLNVGEGRVLYFENSPEQEYFEQNPRNLAQVSKPRYPDSIQSDVSDGLEWIFDDSLPLIAKANPTTAIILKKQKDTTLVHLINYNNYEDPAIIVEEPQIELTFNLLPNQTVKDVLSIWPEGDGAFVNDWRQIGRILKIKLNKLQHFGFIAIKF